MNRYSTLAKDIMREIGKTMSRFMSIFAIVTLGVAFYSGIKMARPNMVLTAGAYFEEHSLSDFNVKSSLGFGDNDIEAIASDPDVAELRVGYTADVYYLPEGASQNLIAKLISITAEDQPSGTGLNKPILTEGRWPVAPNECLLDTYETSVKVGDEIHFLAETGKDISAILKVSTFTVVGKANLPQYLSFERGVAQIGNGKVNAFMLVPAESFAYEAYTDVYVTYRSVAGIRFESDAYKDRIEEISGSIEAIGKVRSPIRKAELLEDPLRELAEAEEKLADGQKAYDEGKEAFDKGIRDGQRKIDDANRQLNEAEASLPKLKSAYASAKRELEDGEAEWKKGKEAYDEGKASLKEGEDQLYQLKTALASAKYAVSMEGDIVKRLRIYQKTGEIVIPPGLADYIENLPEVKAIFGDGFDLEAWLRRELSTRDIDQLIAAVHRSADEARSAIAELQPLVDDLSAQVKEGKAQLADAKAQLDAGRKKLDDGIKQAKQLADLIDSIPGMVSRGRVELKAAQEELNRQRKIGKLELDEAYEEIVDGQRKVREAREEIDKIKDAKWYVFDREGGYTGYLDFQLDAEKVERISVIVPGFFVLVAALVCLTTMSRMVEDERTQIGTLKALGYPPGAIMVKYVGYAVSAALLGSLVGLVVGFTFLPMVIYDAYRIIYILPDMKMHFSANYAFMCTATSAAVTGLSAFWAVRRELKSTPASLMRPKAPEAGKTNAVERIGIIWNALSFLKKVTVRNIFRYKKRVAMTVVGIAGCTALILMGFGLKHSIAAIVDRQFGQIFLYDAIGVCETDLSQEEIAEIEDRIRADPGTSSYMMIYQKQMKATAPGRAKQDVYLMAIPESDRLGEYINLKSGDSSLSMGHDGVVITKKLASLLSLSVGDDISVFIDPNSATQLKVIGIAENYVFNYVYIPSSDYEIQSDSPFAANSFLLNLTEGANHDDLAKNLLTDKNILALSYTEDGGASFRELVKGLNYIVIIIIVFGGMLAFVVLYNLATINMTERIRELATIKVLGFKDGEVSSYLNRENTISAILGVAVGILIGIPLERFVITTAEVDMVMFARDIDLFSYAMAIFLTLFFTFAVNIFLHFRLKKIPMAESLKSVE